MSAPRVAHLARQVFLNLEAEAAAMLERIQLSERNENCSSRSFIDHRNPCGKQERGRLNQAGRERQHPSSSGLALMDAPPRVWRVRILAHTRPDYVEKRTCYVAF